MQPANRIIEQNIKHTSVNLEICKRAACWDDGVLVLDERSLLIKMQLDSTASGKLGLDGAFGKQVRLEASTCEKSKQREKQGTWPTFRTLATCLATRLKETAGTEAVEVHKERRRRMQVHTYRQSH